MGVRRPVVLLYHRITDQAGADPWKLAVSPKNFDAQLAALSSVRRVVPLTWLSRELAAGRLPANVAAITFDDGYRDNLVNARPILARRACPATVFVATGFLGTETGFWWDRLSRLVLEEGGLGPAAADAAPAGTSNAIREALASQGDGSRSSLHLALWSSLREMSPDQRAHDLDLLCSMAEGQGPADVLSLPMTAEEVTKLHDPGFIDIGAHTVSHPPLTSLGGPSRAEEIERSRMACQALVGNVAGFAYPYGDFDAAVARDVAASGLPFACTTEALAVPPRCDPFTIPRIVVEDWTLDDFEREVLAAG